MLTSGQQVMGEFIAMPGVAAGEKAKDDRQQDLPGFAADRHMRGVEGGHRNWITLKLFNISHCIGGIGTVHARPLRPPGCSPGMGAIL